jgi:hypothetical protein
VLLLLLFLLQLWNLPWWSCSSGSCVDRNIDEIAYVETVIKTILSKLSVDKSKVRQFAVPGSCSRCRDHNTWCE